MVKPEGLRIIFIILDFPFLAFLSSELYTLETDSKNTER